MRRSRSRLLKLLLLALVLTALPVMQPWQSLPPAWNPWEPLALEHPLNPVSRRKLRELRTAPDDCLALLASAPPALLDYLALADYTPVASCPLSNVVRVQSTGVTFNTPFTLSCPLLVRWLMFEQQQLQPLALRHQGSLVTTIDHYGTFACRNVYNRASGRRSQHATASAFDVATFRFANGEVASVLSDWDNTGDPANEAFLRDVHKAACDYFGTVLGPAYNDAHANHFHLDTSSFRLCR
jgi:hypothetical protein